MVDEMNDLFSKLKIEWIPYSQITDLKEIAEGGFGIVYKALNNGKVVAIKKLSNSQNSSKYFLNEVIFKSIIYILIFINCYTNLCFMI
jgi:serine/threonine protein kinase